MTGPEHYREAERLMAESDDVLRPHDEGFCEADRMLAAQVHATLALAAALPPGTNSPARSAWASAAAEQRPDYDVVDSVA
ncbi:hypothetical protein ACIQH0_37885 [Streptomyces griseus]|uniref:hypothetical protein n=1 Tax=Streptomyces griseus TaxID=1911 RepID=UPI0037F466EC